MPGRHVIPRAAAACCVGSTPAIVSWSVTAMVRMPLSQQPLNGILWRAAAIGRRGMHVQVDH